jgi:hypothetical protein
MKRLFKLPALLAWGLWLLFSSNSRAQVCDNLAMDFDGDGDYISLSTTGTPVTGDANFTAEAWFTIASPVTSCGSTFRRLITLAGNGSPASRFEVGECNGQLKLFWSNTNNNFIPGGVATISGPLGSDCHHLAVVRNGGLIEIFLDGVLAPIYSGAFTGMLNTNLFRIGSWGGGSVLNSDWQGTVDEVRLWSVPRTAAQIRDYKDCSLSGTSTGLWMNWTFDQGPLVVPGGNNAGSMAMDMSGHGNNGTFSTGTDGFALSGAASNFVCNGCPVRYEFNISDQIALFPVSLSQICVGDKVHFCVTDNGAAISVPSGATVQWESSDGGGPWVADPDMATYPTAINALCFPVKRGVITNLGCANAGLGYVDRKYRARIIKHNGPELCTYTTTVRDLRICCPPTCANLSIVPSIPAPWCEGDLVSINVTLNPCDLWVATGPNVTIDWFLINGSTVTPLPQYQNQLNFTGLQLLVGTNDLCLQATISNCSCPAITLKQCWDVDPMPMCGPIDIRANPPTPISPIPPSGSPYQYIICPGGYSILEMVDPTDFKNCTPVWQYHFDVPIGDPWKNLGSSNSTQNTNTLPQLDPSDPTHWPLGATRIYYRIECRPQSWPNSGCDPCYTNTVEIQLKPAPPSGIISGLTQFCKDGPYPTLTITPNSPGNWTYYWILNGIVQASGPGQTFTATKPGCYYVDINNGCQSTRVGPYCVEECIIVPIIRCPVDNPCACDGLPITLNGCDSYDTCTGTTLTYTWTWDSGTLVSVNGCTLVHIPDPGGTTYYLTVHNSLNPPCEATSKAFYIKPCE